MKNRSKLIVVICAIGIISKEAITFNIYAEESEGKLNNNNSIEIKSNEDTKKIESQLPELDANKELDIESPKVNTNDLSDVESTKPGVNQDIKTDNYENKNLDKLLIEESNLYPRLWVESPREKIINKDVEVKGWALNASGVNEVKVYIDNQYINNAKVGMYRPDVDGVYPGYKDGKNSGFELIIDKNDISSGMHTLKVEAIGNDGSKHVEELPIEVEKPQPRAWIESPRKKIINKDVEVKGWALNASGVNEVKVYIDNQYINNAKVGMYRPDVDGVYPGYKDGKNSGFELIIDKNDISSGMHTLKVEVIGNDGSKHVEELPIEVEKPQPRAWIESPREKIINKDVEVKGWALNASGVNEVKVYIDNQYINNAKVGMYRPDVDGVYPGYKDGKNSGFELIIDKNDISSGTHTLKVEAIGNDGSKHVEELPIEVEKPQSRAWIESPREKIINKDVEVKGWALNASGVNEVKVYIDNQYINNAKVGMYRPDVDGVYPGYKDGKNSGFELIIDKNDISSGMHTLKVEAIGNDGSKHVEELPIEVEKPQPRAWIEEPSGNVMLGSEKGLQISGWALNASGVKKIEVYMDGNYVDDASIGIYRPDVNTAYPGYINGDYSGFRYILDVSKVLYGTHEISIKVIGNDDSVFNCKTTINDAKVIEKQYLSYTFEKQVEEQIKKNTDMKFIRVDGQTKYVKATESDIKYYMDYNNFKNSKDIYQFLKIDTYRNMKDTNTINNYLKSVLKDYENNPLKNQGEGFVEAARKYNIDPIYLIAHTFLETGYGSSNLAKGYEVILDENNNAIYYDKIIDGKTYKFVKIKDKNTPKGTKTIKVYNFFGIGAIDSAPVDGGVTTAYKNGWTSPRLGIEGAAKWISEGYIHRPKFNQNTLYDMRWYYSYENGNWHQYATDINWAKSISGLMYKMEHLYDLQKVNMTYKIPEYKTEYIKSFIYNIFNKK